MEKGLKLNTSSDGFVYAQNYVDGKFEGCASYIDSYEPATGKVWAK